jgi:hypothetical protein
MAYLDQKPLTRTRRPARLREFDLEGHLRGETSRVHEGHHVDSSPSARGSTCPKASVLPTLSRTARRVAIALVWLTPLASAIAVGSGGCKTATGSNPASSGAGLFTATSGTGGTSSSSGTGGTGGAGGNVSGLSCQQLFTTTVLPGLVKNCEPCHVNGGFADFLAPPNQYASITEYKSGTDHTPLIVSPADQSILYTYPDSPDHPGTHYGTALAPLKADVLTWLTCEAKSLPPPSDAGPTAFLAPFKPILGALNVIYLDALGSAYVGSSISFLPNQLGSPPSLLQITTLQVYPAGVALHIVHPRFLVLPSGSAVGEPDPSDSLSSVDEVFTPNGLEQEEVDGGMPTRLLGSGEVLIDNWQDGARLELDFSQGSITVVDLTADGGFVTPCSSPNVYQAEVIALGDGGPHYCAANCHGGNKPTAQAAMDLSGLLESPPDYATACAYMRTRIVPDDPSTSQILEVTNPMSTSVIHMYKFAGDQSQYDNFKMGISSWIMAE